MCDCVVCVCVGFFLFFFISSRLGLVLQVDGGSCGSYILSEWPASAYLEPQGPGYFIFPKHKPPRLGYTHAHTHREAHAGARTHAPAKAMSRLQLRFVRIVYYIGCYPVDNIALLLSSPQSVCVWGSGNKTKQKTEFQARASGRVKRPLRVDHIVWSNALVANLISHL